MRQTKTKQLFEYWMDLYWKAGNVKGSSAAPVWPQRSDVHPSACRSLLGDMFILEIHDDKLIYRLAGTRLCALHGRELKGERFENTFDPDDRDAANRWALEAGTENYIALMSGIARDSLNGKIATETLLMPVACNGTTANRILGLTVECDERLAVISRKLCSQRIRSVRSLRPWENIDGFGKPKEVTSKPAPTPRGLRSVVSEEQIPSMVTSLGVPSMNPRQVAHLRVYDGGKAEI